MRTITRTVTRKPYRSVDQGDAADLWRRYKESPTEMLRNELIELYYHVVQYNADRVHSKLPDQVELDDLTSSGTFGLMGAIDGFDPSRDIKFETYAAPRVRGAILDELRAMDWVPRLVRSRSSQMDKARSAIEKRSGFKPSDEELRLELDVDRDEFEKIRRDSSAVGVSSLSRQLGRGDSSREVCEIDVLTDQRQADPFMSVNKGDLRRFITKGLSRSERLIVVLYYYEQMTMKEIGMTLDLSESRVSQMHSSILERLKAQLAHCGDELQEEMV